jgi:hypothetical protein
LKDEESDLNIPEVDEEDSPSKLSNVGLSKYQKNMRRQFPNMNS